MTMTVAVGTRVAVYARVSTTRQAEAEAAPVGGAGQQPRAVAIGLGPPANDSEALALSATSGPAEAV